jgi:hypothetical protein
MGSCKIAHPPTTALGCSHCQGSWPSFTFFRSYRLVFACARAYTHIHARTHCTSQPKLHPALRASIQRKVINMMSNAHATSRIPTTVVTHGSATRMSVQRQGHHITHLFAVVGLVSPLPVLQALLTKRPSVIAGFGSPSAGHVRSLVRQS